MNRILVVEDEPTIAIALQDDLEDEGYRVEAISDGLTAIEKARAGGWDLILLDVMLPGKDGFSVLREMRKDDHRTPVILLTARGHEQDRITGLSLGADDYVTKPFSRQELLLRVQAVLRRAGPTWSAVHSFGDIQVDCERGEVRRGAAVLDVTALEFRLLLMFLENRGKVLSIERIGQMIWGADTFQSDRVVYTHVNNVRAKIEPVPSQPRYIVSLRGLGYRFDG
ncbi:MAG TPA: response regulator transcription factor [Bryobacteraceae bacterium]|nr:response regulator transcription factor [Bryobacteraceae bacterium]